MSLPLADTAPPVGGAALADVVAVGVGMALVTALLLACAVAHRSRRTRVLARVAEELGRRTGRPSWVALPSLLALGALLSALFGMLWDISLHVADGRDDGPLANPAHYFILLGLLQLFAAGLAAVVLPLDEQPGPAAVSLTPTWQAPVGGLLVMAAAGFALLGFPLDDLWHRLFGQDVTLWGPTHLMLITGAGLSLVGLLVLDQEGRAAQPELTGTGDRRLHWLLTGFCFGGLLMGLSVFQAEYDFGVPQFRLALHPMMIAGAAAFALVTARLLLGRGGALLAAVFFLAVRGGISLVVGPVLGEPTPALPLYAGSALIVELLALTSLARRPLPFGALAGLLVGSVGSVIEAGWSALVMPLPWTPDMWFEGLAMAVPGGVGAGMCGALLALGAQGRLSRPSVARSVVIASLMVLAGATGNGLFATVPPDTVATVALSSAGPGFVTVSVRLDPDVDDPAWLQITAWQGGGLVLDHLERTGPGTYRSRVPIPVGGSWKTLLRVHDGRALAASAIYLPADEAIGAAELPAVSATRPLIQEVEILQRERDLSVPAWTWTGAALVVLGCTLLLLGALAAGVGRLGRRLAPGPDDDPVEAAKTTDGMAGVRPAAIA